MGDKHSMGNYSAGLKEFNQLRAKLKVLMDEDPTRAIEEARLLLDTVDNEFFAGLKASTLVDAGSYVKDKQAVADGIAIFKRLLDKYPDQADWHYNFSNGLIVLTDQEPFTGFDWYLKTADIRHEAITHFQRAITLDKENAIASVAYTNLGNAFVKAYRWGEAYDAYSKALEKDNTNAVALTGAVKILLRLIKYGIGNPEILYSVAARHLNNAKKYAERIKQLAGSQAQSELSRLLQWKPEGGNLPDLSKASKYEKFVATHRLALSPTIEGLDCSLQRWDSLQIKSIVEPLGGVEANGVPPLFAMFNVVKSDFLAARYLAYQALYSTFPESGLYSDTLDYAVYGMVPSMLSLAQRACMDVLDKIAVATSEYFAIPGEVYFSNRWYSAPKKDQPLIWHPLLCAPIQAGNTALIALAELSLDIKKGGGLYQKRSYRNSSTHQFTVLHDIGCSPSRQCDRIEHSEIEHFKSQLIESLQLARAAVLYFVEMISIEEAKKSKSEPETVIGTISIPNHHSIRGKK